MAQSRTAEETKEHYAAQMGEELGAIFHYLWNECVWLNVKWRQYIALFGTSEQRVSLLNRAAGVFFVAIQDALWDDTLLHIARLTDPPQTMGKDNLTLRRLATLVDQGIAQTITKQTDRVLEKAAFARDWRSRRIAHRDLRLALEETAKPLAPASRQAVQDALDAIAVLLNRVDAHYTGGETAFEFASHPGDADSLLVAVRDGLDAKDRRLERLRSGKPLPEDLGPREPV